MNEILLVGAGPIICADTTMTCSYNLRTAKIAHWLRGEGLSFRLAAVDLFGSLAAPSQILPSLVGDYQLFSKTAAGRQALADLISQIQPRAILAISYEAAALVCEIDHPFPVWADMPGWILAEAQLKAAGAGDDAFLDHFAECERTVLSRADMLSVVSRNQRHATLGELALLGRLGRRNINYPLVQILPSLAHDWRPLLEAATEPHRHNPQSGLLLSSQSAIRNPQSEIRTPHSALRTPQSAIPSLPPAAPVLLWSGSYNLWTDVDRIANQVEALLLAVPDLHFVSTGGHLPSHNDEIYGAFLARVEASSTRTRCHILPWQSFSDAIRWFERASLGLCIDGINLEIAYGSRTRVVDMLAHGLPVAATTGTELVDDLARLDALIALDPAAPERWADSITPYLRSPERLRDLARRGQEIIYQRYALPVVGRALLDWLLQPRRAPDLAFLERVKNGELRNADCGLRINPLDPHTAPASLMLREQPMVTWVPQSRIEDSARRVLDPFPSSRLSEKLQQIFKSLLSIRVSRRPALAAWLLASRALPAGSAARWQSRVDLWTPPPSNNSPGEGSPAAPAAPAASARTGRAVYARALRRCADPDTARAINILLARHEYDRAHSLSCFPQRIEIEASSACNLRCRMCKLPFHAKPAVMLSRDLFDRIIPCLKTAATLEFIGEGEPTLNPELPDFLAVAAESGCVMRLFTNGTALTPELSAALVRARVGMVVFSVCSGDRETYRRVTGADLLDRVIENARDLREVKRLLGGPWPRLGLNCPLIAETLESAPALVRLAGGLGIEWIGFGIAMTFRREMEAESILNVNPEKVRSVFERCREAGRQSGIRVLLPPLGDSPSPRAPEPAPGEDGARNRFGCLYPWQSVRVGASGIVESCTYNRKIIGDLRQSTLAEIWNGAPVSRFRGGDVKCDGADYCAICYHRGFRAGRLDPERLFPYDQRWQGYD